jgi:threonine synthase
MGIEQLYFKNETQNPTWSFKDRGSFSTIMMAKAYNEQMTATISTGNMGHSIAAFGAKAGIETIIFVPEYTPEEKINAMTIHEATVVKVIADDYSEMKKEILSTAQALDIRMVSGNNPIRVEGYKSVAFELYEQFGQGLPDYIAVPVSACGHIRGIFKGFRELKAAGFIDQLPKMIVVQAKNNAPIVKALEENKKEIMPFSQFHTIAEAITSGNPYGGNEIIDKALRYDWLYASVAEDDILAGQKLLAQEGYFVEPATATLIHGVKQLASDQKIQSTDRVVLMLTGSGLKDMDVFEHHHLKTKTIELKDVKTYLEKK